MRGVAAPDGAAVFLSLNADGGARRGAGGPEWLAEFASDMRDTAALVEGEVVGERKREPWAAR